MTDGYFEPDPKWGYMRECPFCGHQWPLVKNDDAPGDVWRWVACGDEDECSAQGPCRATTEEAIAAWNTCEDTPAKPRKRRLR